MLWYNNLDYLWSEYETRRQDMEPSNRRRMLRLARESAKR